MASKKTFKIPCEDANKVRWLIQTIFREISLEGVPGFAVHAIQPGDWRVSHIETGLRIVGNARTHIEAIKLAKELARKVGERQLKAKVRSSLIRVAKIKQKQKLVN